MLLVCIRSCLKSVLRYKFISLVPIIRTRYIDVSKDVRIRGYFSKPKGVREKKSLENNALYDKHLEKSNHRLSQPVDLEQEPARTAILLNYIIKFKYATAGTVTNSLKLCMKTENLMPIK